jgi:predicted RNase H-like nuclease (RuvC/YqgF family)
MTEDMAAIMARLDQNNQSQNENYGKLQALVNSINSTSLAEIRNQLVSLKTDNDQMEAGLIAKLDDFKNRTMTKLDNLTGLMALMDDIKSLTTEVQNLKTKVDDVKDQQAGTKKSVEALATPSWGTMVLVIVAVVICVLLLLGSRGGRRDETVAPPESIPVKAQRPDKDGKMTP